VPVVQCCGVAREVPSFEGGKVIPTFESVEARDDDHKIEGRMPKTSIGWKGSERRRLLTTASGPSSLLRF
jgi:hypothetical protein